MFSHLLSIILLFIGSSSRPHHYIQDCSKHNYHCRLALYQLINNERTRHHLYPYKFDWIQTKGNRLCAGSQGHSRAMAKTEEIWHYNSSYPSESFPADICNMTIAAGENVGYGSISQWQAIATVNREMMKEGVGGGHYNNIMSSVYTHIGIGISRDKYNNNWYITEDFSS